MHGFDVTAIQKYLNTDGKPSEFVKEYTKRAICLRQSHKSILSLSDQQETLNATLDSEQLADFVGLVVAYAAYSSLPQKYKDVKLATLDMSAEQLFFINACVKWCAKVTVLSDVHAPSPARCLVPAMNMPEFSRAFGCAPGTPMNPHKKCTFW
ncbi:hypothetical protein MTO96_037007 [Rhipicephalus appendiculatus]